MAVVSLVVVLNLAVPPGVLPIDDVTVNPLAVGDDEATASDVTTAGCKVVAIVELNEVDIPKQ